jgi:hypothetical protein
MSAGRNDIDYYIDPVLVRQAGDDGGAEARELLARTRVALGGDNGGFIASLAAAAKEIYDNYNGIVPCEASELKDAVLMMSARTGGETAPMPAAAAFSAPARWRRRWEVNTKSRSWRPRIASRESRM